MLAFVLIVASLWFVAQVTVPRGRGTARECLLYFGAIIGRTREIYAAEMRAQTVAGMLNDLSSQTFTVANIVETKFAHLRGARWVRDWARNTRRVTGAIVLGMCVGRAHAQVTPAGLWKTIGDDTRGERSLVRITEADGVFTGRIEKLLDPAIKPDAVCLKCDDERKDRPLVGMTLIRGVRQSAGNHATWDGGEILDPENGKTYAVRLTPSGGGKTLAVRGFIGTPLLGRSQTWIRVE